MTIIYCVQSATDLHGQNGYSSGLLEAGHPKLLVSFLDYMDKGHPILRPKSPLAGKRLSKPRKPTLNAKKP